MDKPLDSFKEPMDIHPVYHVDSKFEYMSIRFPYRFFLKVPKRKATTHEKFDNPLRLKDAEKNDEEQQSHDEESAQGTF